MPKKLKPIISLLTCIVIMVSILPNYIIPFLLANAVSDSEIVNAAEEIIVASEGNYGAINANDNGALSIGKLQWHATRALTLLQSIIAKNQSQALSVLGSTLYSEITSASSWETRTLSSDESTVVSALLKTSEGIEAQDELAYNDILSYVTSAKALGITDPATLVYFCDVNNQHGYSCAKRVTLSAYALAGSYSGITPALYHTAALSDSSAGKYPTRRENVYNYVMSLGWETVATDYEIGVPYPRPDGSISTDEGSDSDIRWLQSALNILGDYDLSVNGIFNSETQNALMTFESENDLTCDGVCDTTEISYIAQLLIQNSRSLIASYYTVTTNGANLNMRSGPSTSYSILASIPNETVIGVYSISDNWAYITYNGITGYCSAEWITFSFDNYVTSLSILSLPKTVYSFGESLDLKGLLLKADYYSGDYEYVTSGFSASADMTITGSQLVTVTYKSQTVQYEIEIDDEIIGISIGGTPKSEYTYGSELSYDGFCVIAEYKSGASENIYSGFTQNADTTILGQQKVIVSYSGFTASYDILVTDKVSDMHILTFPKTEYIYGEALDTSGLTVELTYLSGKTEITSTDFRILGSPSALGENVLTVFTNGLAEQFSIFVARGGDASLNGKLDSFDALLMLQNGAGLTELSSLSIKASDSNYDGIVNSVDALALLKYITYSTDGFFQDPDENS